MNIEEARKKMNMSKKTVSASLGIPYRTLCGWESRERTCPDYVEKMVVEKILEREGEKGMDELKKCYEKLNELMKKIENKHDTDIMDFINLDDEVKDEYMGDWTEKDVQAWEYLAHRIEVIREAYDIMRMELRLGELLPEISEEP